MRYRDTRGDDELIGTAADDIFLIRRGMDRVVANYGDDLLKVDYAPLDMVAYARDWINADPSGYYQGIFYGAEGTSVAFEGIDRITYIGSNARNLLTVTLNGPAGDGKLKIDGGGGQDSLELYLDGPSGEIVQVLADGALSTRIGTFTGFERLAVFLGGGGDSANGGANADYFYAGTGFDRLRGGGGDDFLYGGRDPDELTGGTGADTFYYFRVSDSRGGNHDEILDFSHAEGDRIDLSRIDANPFFERNQAFAFIGTRAFSGASGSGGEVRQQVNGDGTITVQADRNGDGVADLTITVHADAPLVAADFVL